MGLKAFYVPGQFKRPSDLKLK